MDIEWLGPYRIHQIKTPHYGILIDSVIKKIHGNRLKTYFSERDPP